MLLNFYKLITRIKGKTFVKIYVLLRNMHLCWSKYSLTGLENGKNTDSFCFKKESYIKNVVELL